MKYKLLKDLSLASAGKIYELYDSCEKDSITLFDRSTAHFLTFPKDTFSEWFEEVDERWKPKPFEICLTLNGELMPIEFIFTIYTDEELWESGLVFRTRELAEQAAEQIKALLKEFHRNNP